MSGIKTITWKFMVCYFSYVSIYIARINLSMATPGIIEAQIADGGQIGILGSVFSVCYSVGRLLNGFVSDKVKPWIMISLGLLTAGLSNFLFASFPTYLRLIVIWAVNAYAQSMLWSSILNVVASLYAKETAKKKTAIMVTSVAVGNILGILINTWLIEMWGLRYAFLVPAIITILCAVINAVTIRGVNNPPVSKGSHMPILNLLQGEVKMVLIPAFMHGVMKENISFWMAVYFVDTFLIDLKASAYYILLIPVVGLVGRVVYPEIYKLFGEKEHKVSIAGFVLCAIFSVVLLYQGITPLGAGVALSGIYAAMSMINTSMLSIYPLHYQKTGNVASVSGMMDFATYLGSGCSAFLYGMIIQKYGYEPMFISWILVSAISVLILLYISQKKLQRKTM